MLKAIYESMTANDRARVKSAVVRIAEGAAELVELALKLTREEVSRKKEKIH